GPGFTIDAQVDINGSPQYIKYKVQNWKGSTFHITVSHAYVNVN
ncbi:N-acetylmuramoyl-L-alanine amidase, partial [Bacillus toyonensis]